MVYVSVSAYNDGELLPGCIERIREVLPDAHVAVVDGRYETWPDGPDNSDDRTPALARELADSYHPDGPFETEADKHRHRVSLAPIAERALFLDTDERLLSFDPDALPRGRAYKPRIFNPLVYSQSPIRYWPRVFTRARVAEIRGWDAYVFRCPTSRSDACTIVHRHDLRDRDYRERKYQRFENEDRTGRYDDDRFESYLEDDWDVEPDDHCPKCGRESVVWSPWTGGEVTGQAGVVSKVGCCVAGDCWIGETREAIDTARYLDPDALPRGRDEDPERLRKELLAVGCPLVAQYPVTRFAPEVLINWVDEHVDDAQREVIA